MELKRRNFLKLTGAAGGALVLNSVMGNSLLAGCTTEEDARRIKKFGLQLWTVRDQMAKDPKVVLQQLASYGYSFIESFEGAQGMFWGMSHTDFKKYITDLGMTMHSAHCDTSKDLEKKAAQAAEIGMKYLIMPWEGPNKTIADYRKMADDFNKAGDICKKAGIRFAFHNHDFTFKQMEGQFAQDVLMQNTNPDTVFYEMDIFWVVAAGQDPEAWLKKYPGRFKLSHVKDRTKSPGTEEGKNSVDLGTGTINFSKVLKTARQQGMEYYVVEQEAFSSGTPLDAAKANAGYMKKLKA